MAAECFVNFIVAGNINRSDYIHLQIDNFPIFWNISNTFFLIVFFIYYFSELTLSWDIVSIMNNLKMQLDCLEWVLLDHPPERSND